MAWSGFESDDAEKTEVIRPTDDEKTVVLPDTNDEKTVVLPDTNDEKTVVLPDTNDEKTVVVPRPTAAPAPAPQPAAPPQPAALPPSAAQPYRATAFNPFGLPHASAVQTPNAVPGPAAFPPAQRSTRRATKNWLIPLLAATAIVAVSLIVVAVLRPGPVKDVLNAKLDVTAAQSQVHAVLTDPDTGYGLHDVDNVICNHGANVVISNGWTFTCDFTIGGRPNRAVMTFVDDSGTYSVGRPQ